MLSISETDYKKVEGGIQYFGFKVGTAETDRNYYDIRDETEFLLSGISYWDGAPHQSERDPEPFFVYPNVVVLGHVYSKDNAYSSEMDFPNDGFGDSVERVIYRADVTAKQRTTYLLDYIRDPDRPSSEKVLALVVITEAERNTEQVSLLRHFDGSITTFSLPSVHTTSTTIEWRIKGVGLTRSLLFHGLRLDGLLSSGFFKIEPRDVEVIPGFEGWLNGDSRLTGQKVVLESRRIDGNTVSPRNVSRDVTIIDGKVSLFGFEEVVIPPDQPPVVSGFGDFEINSPQVFETDLDGRDPNEGFQDIEFSIIKGPDLGETLDSRSGLFHWEITSAIPDGLYEFLIRAREVGPYSLDTLVTNHVTVNLRKDKPPVGVVARVVNALENRLSVTLQVDPLGGTSTYSVEETVPSNLLVSEVLGGGVFDANSSKIKWGPFFDNSARKLDYVLTAPSDFTGVVAFRGVGSFDGDDIAVTGVYSIKLEADTTDAPFSIDSSAFEIVTVGGGQFLALTVNGTPGRTYQAYVKNTLSASEWTESGPPQVAGSGPLTLFVTAPSTTSVFLIVAEIRDVNPTAMVKLPAGTFVMGSPETEAERSSAETQHTVTLTKDFYMSKYEVTQKEYMAVMGNNPSRSTGYLNRPVEQVSWNDAMAYCEKVTSSELAAGRLPVGWEYRLPTEAEWEYACRAGTTTPFHYGNNLLSGMANFNGRNEYVGGTGRVINENGIFLTGTTTVGSYAPNAFGLFDMHGNVSEWCLDWYDSYPGGSVNDPRGPSTGWFRVFRGGGWISSFGGTCRSAYRSLDTPGYRYIDVGFRVVLAPGQ
ncbi:MAG: formylglycine-generating enzyme family protein [Verrucomicrobia bacterium]|nr:formylglycine-generating enzyme family protein [Verrucomicrobiota bacterium]